MKTSLEVVIPNQTPAPTPPAPTPPAPAPTPAPVPEPTIAEQLQEIESGAQSVQTMLNTLKQNESAGTVRPPTYDPYPTYQELYPEINEDKIRRDQMRLFQSEINATNKIYDEMLGQERLRGTGRLGTQRAMSARSGLLGSDFGEANRAKTESYNVGQENLVQAERQAKVGAIMGRMRQAVSDEIAAKRLARSQDYDTYTKYLAGAKERRQANLALAAQSLLNADLDPLTMDQAEIEAIGKEAGLSANDIINSYLVMKQAQDAAEAKATLEGNKTQAEIDKLKADAANSAFFTLSEGQARYDAEGNLVASKAKTYAPGTGSKGGVPSSVETTVRDKLESLRGEDTYTDTKEYLNEYAAYVEGGGAPEEFLKSFDPDKYINPNDPTRGWLESQMKKVNQENPLDQMIAGALAEALLPQE